MLPAGDFDKRITFQQLDGTVDELNQPSTEWVDFAKVWASITSLSSREVFAAQASQSEVSHRITVRYSPRFEQTRLVAAMRVVYKGRIFNLHSANNVKEGNHTIVILASEGLNNG